MTGGPGLSGKGPLFTKDDMANDITHDTRIDEYALDTFGNMGYDVSQLPDSLVRLYRSIKIKKDVVFPSRMSAEGCAIVAAISDMMDKRGDFAVAEKKKKDEA